MRRTNNKFTFFLWSCCILRQQLLQFYKLSHQYETEETQKGKFQFWHIKKKKKTQAHFSHLPQLLQQTQNPNKAPPLSISIPNCYQPTIMKRRSSNLVTKNSLIRNPSLSHTPQWSRWSFFYQKRVWSWSWRSKKRMPQKKSTPTLGEGVKNYESFSCWSLERMSCCLL